MNACAKIDETSVGAGLIPDVDNVHTFEVILPVEIDNHLLADSTRITASSSNAVGILQDPVFGETNAATYFSVNPSRYGVYPFTNAETAVLDSVVLSLAYSVVYGDTTLPQTLEVYPIKTTPGNFKADSVYKINDIIEIEDNPIGSKSFLAMHLRDSIMYIESNDTVYNTGLIRIPITDMTWANQFLTYDTTLQYQNDSIFRTYFRGLAVKAASSSANKRTLTYWDISNSEKTKLTFYYRYSRTQDGQVIEDTAAYSMFYNYAQGQYQGAQANLITRTPGGDFDTYVNNGTPDDDLAFIQTSPGSYVSVDVKGLDTFALTNRIIHRAELVFNEIPSTDQNTFLPPGLLFIDALSITGDSVFTIRRDFTPSTNSQYGYDVNTIEGFYRNNQYKFNISRYVQSIVTNQLPSYKFRVYSPYATYPFFQDYYGNLALLSNYLFISDYIAAGRTVLGGGSHPSKKAYLRIVYSKL